VDQGAPANSPTVEKENEHASDNKRVLLEEIVVTAQKRTERLQDVPVPVTVLNGETLVDNSQTRLENYYTTVPGLSMASTGGGDAYLTIRGISTGANTSPTVGIVIDDVPFGSTSAIASATAPDIDPSDLARIEILRGPQGTLYGASSIGGLLKFVTVDPSTERLSGRVQADTSRVYNGAEAGYGARVAANVPLSDTLAIRASGFARQDPGYIDDPVLHRDGVNKTKVGGGHVSALWRPSATWSLKLSALVQNVTANGSSVSLQAPGGYLRQVQTLALGGYHREVRSYTATLAGSLGGVQLTSISGYNVDNYHNQLDQSGLYGGLLPGVAGFELLWHSETKKVSQEIRLSGALQGRMDWLLGVFYTHENSPCHNTGYAVDPGTSSVGAQVFDDPFPTTYAEYAAFGDLTVHLSDRLEVQIGGCRHQQFMTKHFRLRPGDPLSSPL
jgi:outer membrane receptor protein involved in Fe transport